MRVAVQVVGAWGISLPDFRRTHEGSRYTFVRKVIDGMYFAKVCFLSEEEAKKASIEFKKAGFECNFFISSSEPRRWMYHAPFVEEDRDREVSPEDEEGDVFVSGDCFSEDEGEYRLWKELMTLNHRQ